ncbi:hypothetical protein [Nonomuraea sp. NPDC049480]|uniref:hypothetical protein n=1 Tax=Nonomuraea sp. NPDC049480 TaxID=3364353 RepID=UPI00379F4FB8
MAGFAALATATAVAAGTGLVGGPATSYANAAASIKKTDEYFSVSITDPTADRHRFEEAFRAVGLNVTVKVIPVAPYNVGKLIGPMVPDGFTWPPARARAPLPARTHPEPQWYDMPD